MIPLLSPKVFSEFTPEEFRDYVTSLYQEPERATPPANYNVRVNRKGTPVIRVNRSPKFLTQAEVTDIAQQINWSYQKLWLHLRKKKMEIKVR
jgi:hypothetical protein